MSYEEENKVVLELDRSEALVIFEWLAKQEGSLPFTDETEQAALWRLEGALEAVLPEILSSGYRDLLAEAKRRIAGAQGASSFSPPPSSA